MSARTPGKWSVFCMGGSIAVVRRHAGRITDIALDVEGESKKQRKANARLMAAAPDMYEALRAVAANIDRAELNLRPTEDDIAALRAQVRAALAKADIQ